MGRPRRLATGALLAAALAAGGCSGTSQRGPGVLPPIVTAEPATCVAAAGVDDMLVPACGVLLGTTDAAEAGVVPLGLDHQERTISAINDTTPPDAFTFDLLRVYHRGPRGAVGALRSRLAQLDDGNERLLYFSWKVDTGRGAWQRIADGDRDGQVERFAEVLARSGHTIFLSLHHEPEGDAEGTAEEYVAMWRHVHDVVERVLAETAGGGDVVWVMNYQGHVNGERLDQVDAYFPGRDHVDWLSFNPYNWAVCNPRAEWRSFLDVASPLYQYLTSEPRFLGPAGEPKPLMIGETASNEDPDDPNRKAVWLRDMAKVLEGGKLPHVRAVVYFNQSAPQFCDRHWDSSEASAEAFAEIAARAFFDPLGAASGGG